MCCIGRSFSKGFALVSVIQSGRDHRLGPEAAFSAFVKPVQAVQPQRDLLHHFSNRLRTVSASLDVNMILEVRNFTSFRAASLVLGTCRADTEDVAGSA